MGTSTLGFLLHNHLVLTSLQFTTITAAPRTTSHGCHHHHLPCTSTACPPPTAATTSLPLPSTSIGVLSNLTNLEELDLNKNNIGNGILPSLNKLSNLKFLRLASNKLNGSTYVKGNSV
ncbi:hypothetical protein RHSIM_Rhsim01G0054000 [Rhododendron simsii]|uniref:Uncharacterized protein n=1 Tax=Rhododendron simsii TaxID=118357 RepID=A0A834HL84_RHOSS|nr:hypothetical protein RHSIM_Rhsim01G0054000 [Rhododendron simsii]